MKKSLQFLRLTNNGLKGQRIGRSEHNADRYTATAVLSSVKDEQTYSVFTNNIRKRERTEKNSHQQRTSVEDIPEITDSLRTRLKHVFSGNLPIYLGSSVKYKKPMCKLKIPGKQLVVLNTPESIKNAFLKEKHATSDRLCPYFQEGIFDHKGFAFSDFSRDSKAQKSILGSYIYNKTKHKREEVYLHGAISRLIDSMVSCNDTNVTVHLKEFLTDNFSHMLIGEPLPEKDPDREALWELIDLLYAMLEPSMDIPLKTFPFLRFLPTKYGRLYDATIKARDRVAKRFFSTQKATFQEGHIRGLIDVCLQMQTDEIRKTGSSWLSDDYIRGLMYDTTLAGMTEMMKSLRILILLMCHHQDIQSRVYAEICDVIGTDKTPTSDHREHMPYTQAVIMEMLRYISQTPLAIPHKCNKDVILDGYLIEKDSGIVPNLWGIHHDEAIWGDPWVFRPDRFLRENGKLISKDHTLMKSFLPFSVGKRRCPGESFAMSRINLIFVTLLQQVSFLPPEEEPLPSVDPRLYTNKFPLNLPVYTCKVTRRNN